MYLNQYKPQSGLLEDMWNALLGKKKESEVFAEEQKRSDDAARKQAEEAFEEPPPGKTCDPRAHRFDKKSCNYIGIDLKTIAVLGIAAFFAHKLFMKKKR